MTNAKLDKKPQTQKKRALKSLEKKLLSYSVAAGAAITCVENAQAVQYKDLNDVVIKDNELDPYFLDFNDDNINDFKIIHSGRSYGNSVYKIQLSGASVHGLNGNGFVVIDGNQKRFVVNKLEAGDQIDGNGPFNPRGNFGLHQTLDVVNKPSTETNSGNFLGADNAFFGVRFSDGTDNYFGWGRVSMPGDGSQLILHDVAYNENPDEAIKAGYTGYPSTNALSVGTPVPEPGTLGMLALGAAGVYAWRRRKDKATN